MTINKYRIEAMLELAIAVYSVAPHTGANIVHTVRKLESMARALRRRYENECSHKWAETARYREGTSKLEARIESKVFDFNAPPGKLAFSFQSDPRGWALTFNIEGDVYRL